MQVLFDHVGYEPDTPIRLLVEAPADTVWEALAVVRLPSGDAIAATDAAVRRLRRRMVVRAVVVG